MLFGKKKEKEQRSVLEEEQMQSPFRTIIKNLLENKLAMGGLIVFVSIFAMCFILPIWFHQDLNYQDPTQKNIAPGFSFLSVPSDLKDNAEVIEFGPTYGVGVDKDGYVYEWGQLTKNLKKFRLIWEKLLISQLVRTTCWQSTIKVTYTPGASTEWVLM